MTDLALRNALCCFSGFTPVQGGFSDLRSRWGKALVYRSIAFAGAMLVFTANWSGTAFTGGIVIWCAALHARPSGQSGVGFFQAEAETTSPFSSGSPPKGDSAQASQASRCYRHKKLTEPCRKLTSTCSIWSDSKGFRPLKEKSQIIENWPCISAACTDIPVNGDVAEWSKALPC